MSDAAEIADALAGLPPPAARRIEVWLAPAMQRQVRLERRDRAIRAALRMLPGLQPFKDAEQLMASIDRRLETRAPLASVPASFSAAVERIVTFNDRRRLSLTLIINVRKGDRGGLQKKPEVSVVDP